MTDAIGSLTSGMRSAEAGFDVAAQQIATDDLPTSSNPDPTDPSSPQPAAVPGGDLVGQLVTMTTAADLHHVTAAALRSAMSMYRDSLDLVSPPHGD